VADVQALGHAGAEIVYQHVGIAYQLQQCGVVVRTLEVEHDAALAAVDAEEGAALGWEAWKGTGRRLSPLGGSTLITSAPWSASSEQAYGPAM
jgi:hypothetical protein